MIDLDYETYSELDLTKVGAYKYARHPSTEVTLVSFAEPNQDIYLIDYTMPTPSLIELSTREKFMKLLLDPNSQYAAFNATFEYLITKYVLKIDVKPEQFFCTMDRAWHLGFSGSLGAVGQQMGLGEDSAKMKRGKVLINKFCKPAPTSHKVDRYDCINSPEEWEEFREYAVYDTLAERKINMLLSKYPYPARERYLWLMDHDINAKGLPIDVNLVTAARKVARIEKHFLKEDMIRMTGLDNPNSGPQMTEWLNDRCIFPDNLRAETVEDLIKTVPDETVKQVLTMRKQAGKASTAKWDAFATATEDDAYLRGMFQFYGAQRTGRWAGRLVQLHNLAQGGLEDPITAADTILNMGHEGLKALYEMPIMNVLSSTIRCAITAPENMTLDVCDLSSIESRVLGFITNCQYINGLFATGKDSYKDFASRYYGVAYDEVTKGQRKFSKPPVLGCGYQLGAIGLVTYAEGYGVELTERQAGVLVDLWRELHPEVKQAWQWLVDAVMYVIENPAEQLHGYTVNIRRDEDFLFIDLPSGRSLAYYQPMVRLHVPPWGGSARPTITYMGMDSFSHKWTRLRSHGGKLIENIVQAIARDILAEHMVIMVREGIDVRGHVHDEVIALSDIYDSKLDRMKEIMSLAPSWLPGILLGADGFTTRRYRKD